MKDTFSSRLHDLFLGCSIEKHRRPKPNQNKLAKMLQVNSTWLLVYFIFQEAQKKPRDKPLLNPWKSIFCLQNLTQTLLLPHSGSAASQRNVPLRGSGTKQVPQLFLCTEQMLGLQSDNLFQHRPGKSRCLSGSLAPRDSWPHQQNEQMVSYTTRNLNNEFSSWWVVGPLTSSTSSEGSAISDKAPHMALCICKGHF